MTNEQQMLLALLAKALFSKTKDHPKEIDWDRLCYESKVQSVPVIAFEAADKSLIPADVLDKWKKTAEASLLQNIRVITNHVHLNEWLKEAGVPYVILKGCASSSYYPNPSYRSMGDVDFLVPEDRIKSAGAVLEKHGLSPVESDHPAHIEYIGARGVFELHFSVAGIPEREEGDLIKEYLSDIFEGSRMKSIEFGSASLPSAFHHGLVMLVHTCCHLVQSGIGLRHICDWAVFENSLSDSEFRELFEEKLKRVGLWKYAQILTLASVKYLGADPREWAASGDERSADMLMDDVLSGGNFGRRDKEREEQTPFIAFDKDTFESDDNKTARRFIRSKNDRIRKAWPAAKRCPLLLPVGWVVFGFIFLFRIVTGRRNRIDIKKTIDGADARRELYRNLELYKT